MRRHLRPTHRLLASWWPSCRRTNPARRRGALPSAAAAHRRDRRRRQRHGGGHVPHKVSARPAQARAHMHIVYNHHHQPTAPPQALDLGPSRLQRPRPRPALPLTWPSATITQQSFSPPGTAATCTSSTGATASAPARCAASRPCLQGQQPGQRARAAARSAPAISTALWAALDAGRRPLRARPARPQCLRDPRVRTRPPRPRLCHNPWARPPAAQVMQKRALEHPKITVLWDSVVEEAYGNERVRAVD